MKTASVVRISDVHENKQAYRTATKKYCVLYVVGDSGEFIPCLLTEDDLNKGIDRANKNPEDVLQLYLLQRLVHKFLNLFF